MPRHFLRTKGVLLVPCFLNKQVRNVSAFRDLILCIVSALPIFTDECHHRYSVLKPSRQSIMFPKTMTSPSRLIVFNSKFVRKLTSDEQQRNSLSSSSRVLNWLDSMTELSNYTQDCSKYADEQTEWSIHTPTCLHSFTLSALGVGILETIPRWILGNGGKSSVQFGALER